MHDKENGTGADLFGRWPISRQPLSDREKAALAADKLADAGELRPLGEVVEAIATRLADRDWRVRRSTVCTLGLIRTPLAMGHIAMLLERETEPRVVDSARGALSAATTGTGGSRRAARGLN